MKVFVLFIALMCTAVMAERKHRDKRYIFVNPDAPITLGFLLNMPISLALPTLAQGRSLDLQNLDGEVEHPEDLDWDPAYTDQLGRLNVYFAHLELMSVACQERLICDMAASPESYSPIAEIILKEIRQRNGPVQTTQDNLMWRYMSAARTGFSASTTDCAIAFPQCPLGADKIVNLPVLKVWQYIAGKLNLKLV
ncbi:unnamed protein product [Meganyctiphanes norvegica]|uniref:Uncharacterized protein n=1 Tax=Meganyctiphanes norvegica TaxID=48144 RepID=A0AAV2S1L6_MEGNR